MTPKRTTRRQLWKGWSDGRLWALQAVGTAVLLLAVVWWLQLGEATYWQVGLNFVLAAVIVVGTLVLEVVTLRRLSTGRFAVAWRLLPAFVAAVAVGAAGWRLIALLAAHQADWPTYWRSLMALGVRNELTASILASLMGWIVVWLTWWVLPALVLPLWAETARRGWRGFSWATWRRAIRGWRYWMGMALAAVLGVCLPGILLAMGPESDSKASLHAQQVDLAVRLVIAYVLVLAAWIAACSLASLRPQAAEDEIEPVPGD